VRRSCDRHGVGDEGKGDLVPPHLAQSDFDNVCQSVSIQDVCDGIPHIHHQDPQPAMFFVRAGAPLIGGLAYTLDWGERSVNQTHNLPNRDALRRPSQKVATMLPPPAFQVTAGFELH